MIVQHNITGEILRAVQIGGRFTFDGQLRPAGTVILLRKRERTLITASGFDTMFTVLPDGHPKTRGVWA